MITTLIILLGATILGTWFYTMYVSWKIHTGTTIHPIQEEDIATQQERASRLTRKYWYRVQFKINGWLTWISAKLSKCFFIVFPGAIPAFTKKDPLTGLEQGPTSYFLKQISESRPEDTGLRNRKKKV